MIRTASILHLSEWLLRLAIRVISPQLPGWDQAMLAELQVVQKPLEAFSWSLGCVWVVVQEGISRKFAEFSRPLTQCKKEGLMMRNAKATAIAAILVTFLVFTFTSFHQAMHVAAESLIEGPELGMHGESQDKVSTSELDQLRKNAEQQQDAKLLAYVSINDPRSEVAQATADRAVSLDAQWTWVYYVLAGRTNFPNQKMLIAKLQQWDPQNSANYFLEADQITNPGATISTWETTLTGSEAWLPAEARALSLPKYDSYSRQHFNLEREIVLKSGGGPFRLYRELAAHPFARLDRLHLYSGFALQGSTAETARQARQLISLGEQMSDDNAISQVAPFFGGNIAQMGYKKLAAIGTPEERVFAAARIEQLHIQAVSNAYPWLDDTLAANAVVVQLCLMTILASTLLMAVSFLGILFHRGKSMHALLWGSSTLMVASCIVGYVSYMPFAQMWKELASQNIYIQPSSSLLFAFNSFFTAHHFAQGNHTSLAVYGWNALIFVLVAMLLVLTARKLPMHRVVAQA